MPLAKRFCARKPTCEEYDGRRRRSRDKAEGEQNTAVAHAERRGRRATAPFTHEDFDGKKTAGGSSFRAFAGKTRCFKQASRACSSALSGLGVRALLPNTCRALITSRGTPFAPSLLDTHQVFNTFFCERLVSVHE